jgi:hypothetical protein
MKKKSLPNRPKTGRSIAANLNLSNKLIHKAASHDAVISGGCK